VSIQIGIRVPETLAAQIDARGERAEVIRRDLQVLFGLLTEYAEPLDERAGTCGPERALRRDLGRYYALLERGRAEARARLSEEEVRAIAGALNGILHEPWSMPLLPAEIEDSVAHENLADRHGIDGPALVEKLTHLSAGATWAVIDACERHWNQIGAGEQPDACRLLEEPAREERRL